VNWRFSFFIFLKLEKITGKFQKVEGIKKAKNTPDYKALKY